MIQKAVEKNRKGTRSMEQKLKERSMQNLLEIIWRMEKLPLSSRAAAVIAGWGGSGEGEETCGIFSANWLQKGGRIDGAVFK